MEEHNGFQFTASINHHFTSMQNFPHVSHSLSSRCSLIMKAFAKAVHYEEMDINVAWILKDAAI